MQIHLGSMFYNKYLNPTNRDETGKDKDGNQLLAEYFDVVLANPPFTGNIDKNDIGRTLKPLGTTKTELLFVDLILQMLKPGGRAAVIVPEGVLFGSSTAHQSSTPQAD